MMNAARMLTATSGYIKDPGHGYVYAGSRRWYGAHPHVVKPVPTRFGKAILVHEIPGPGSLDYWMHVGYDASRVRHLEDLLGGRVIGEGEPPWGAPWESLRRAVLAAGLAGVRLPARILPKANDIVVLYDPSVIIGFRPVEVIYREISKYSPISH